MAAVFAMLAIAPAANAKGTAFVNGSGSSTVAAHALGADGSPALIGTQPTGAAPRAAVVTPDAKHLYVSAPNGGNGSISIYDIAAGGGLTQASGSPLLLGAGKSPEGLAISPNGQFLYAADTGDGTVKSFSIGASGALTPVGSPAAAPGVHGAAVTADGLRLYASSDGGVRGFDIAADGSLTPVAGGGPFPAGTGPKGIATSPDARFVYVGATTSATVTAFAIGPAGELTSLGSVPTSNTPQTVAVTPDGRFLYVASFGGSNIGSFAIGANGALTPVPGQPYGASLQVYGLDAAPNNRQLYGSNFNNNLAASINVYDIHSAGELTQITGSPFPAGVNGSEFQSVAITPNQGPTAQFTATAEGAGQPSSFNGSASADSDGGAVARFDWDFGDGQTLPNGGPTPAHTYAAPGSYTVTLTVTDDEGCANAVLFTGQTADCNGSGAARSQQTIQVAPGDPELEISGKRKQELRRNVVVKAVTEVDAEAVAKGRLSIDPGRKGRRALIGFKLKKDSEDLEAGRKTKLKPKLSKLAFEVASDALREGGKVTAKVKVKATSAGGETDTATRKVKLTR